jgi:hypothetical protein
MAEPSVTAGRIVTRLDAALPTPTARGALCLPAACLQGSKRTPSIEDLREKQQKIMPRRIARSCIGADMRTLPAAVSKVSFE